MTSHYLIALSCALLFAEGASSTTLSSNLSNSADGTEIVSGQTWVATSFGTGASPYTLSSMTLVLSAVPGTKVILQLYSDLSQPSQPLALLKANSAVSSAPSNITFEGAGYFLTANTTYWAVLQTAGTAQWAYTNNSNGSGIGFQHTWAVSEDAGADWLTFDSYPMLFEVSASPTSSTISPEPGTAVVVLGILILLSLRCSRELHLR